MSNVEKWYDENYDEWGRLSRHRIEYDITTRYLDKYIDGQGLKIFDIGGGPGRYSLYLASKGHKVTLLDLSSKNISVAKQKSEELGVELEGYIHGNALSVEGEEAQYDVVLLMGPLYHLIEEEDRETALAKAKRLLKPGGIIFASFISCYAPIIDHLKGMHGIESVDKLLKYLDDGVNEGGSGFTDAYFSYPLEIKELMMEQGFEQKAFACVENILSSKETEIYGLSEEQYNKWIELAFRLSENQHTFASGEHYLYIGAKHKPGLHLREISEDNYNKVLKLSDTLTPGQQKCVASNTDSIIQATFDDEAWHRAIYLDDEPIGFVMLEVGMDQIYLWRYMIAKDHQRSGYGKRVLDMVKNYALKREIKLIKTSVELGEESPYDFYISYGFKDTGEKLDCGEQILELKID